MNTSVFYLLPSIASWMVVWYLFASIICFAVYAIDKSAAIAGRRRISEKTLISCGLLGGWPGAIVAQRFLRHKTSKTRFLLVFWLSAALNIAALMLIFRSIS